jgi:hypothetical protein
VTASQLDIWRQRVWVWAVALGFLVVNCLGLVVYQVGYSDRVKTLRVELVDAQKQLDDTHAEALRLSDLLRQARFNREGILRLYGEHFSTRRRRLTGVTAEVEALASRAGLMPRAINFPEVQIQQYGLIKRSFIFAVDGSYTDLRKFINLLELSDSFLTLESASLNEEAVKRTAGARPGGYPVAAPAGVGVRPSYPGAQPLPQMGGPVGGGLAAGGAAGVAGAGSSAGASGSAAPGAPLRMGLTISTLFSSQEEPKDALAPLPGSTVPPRGGKTP